MPRCSDRCGRTRSIPCRESGSMPARKKVHERSRTCEGSATCCEPAQAQNPQNSCVVWKIGTAIIRNEAGQGDFLTRSHFCSRGRERAKGKGQKSEGSEKAQGIGED